MATICSEYTFSKQNFTNLKSLAMLMIIYHHVLKEFLPLSPVLDVICEHFGYIGAGVFFFLSGYGLSKSFEKNNIVRKEWIKNKVIKLYIPFIFIFILSLFLILVFKKEYSLFEATKDFLTFSLPNKTTWFYKVIIGFYVLMPLVYRLRCNNQIRSFVVLLVTIIYIILASKIADSYWYNTVLNFPLGMIVANFPLLKGLRFTKYLVSFLSVLFILSFFVRIPAFILSLCVSYLLTIIFGLLPMNFGKINILSSESIKYYLFHVVLLDYVVVLNCGITISLIVLLSLCTIIIFFYNRVVESRIV